jgi:hypothetical protein
MQAWPFLATKLITDKSFRINHLALVYSIVTLGAVVPAAAGRFVEFRGRPRSGLSDG